MGKYKYLANNIALFSISNFVSKILVFLLVPFYTGVLTTSEYGTADVMQTTLLLLVPALTINMGEAALRFGIDHADRRGLIFRIGMKYTLRASFFVFAGCVVASFFLPPWLAVLFFALFVTNSIYEFLILFFQGCELVRVVVCGSVFSTLLLICSNLLFLLVFKAGLPGYIISQIVSFSGAALLMLYLGRKGMEGQEASPTQAGEATGRSDMENRENSATASGEATGQFDMEGRENPEIPSGEATGRSATEGRQALEKELLDYGKPMILYSTGAWINNAADRYFVSIMCGLSVNGLYGVAYKIPSILTVFQRIFAQAWQISATKSREEEKSEEFYSEMYKLYFAFMILGAAFLILLVRPLAAFMFRKDFFEAWRFVPPLLISVIFGAMTGFLGSICLAFKDSRAMGVATGTGATINIVLNLLLIPRFSAMGASVATAISYFIMFAMAFIFVRRHVRLETDLFRDGTASVLVVLEAVFVSGGEGSPRTYAASAVICLLLLILYNKWLREVIERVIAYSRRGR